MDPRDRERLRRRFRRTGLDFFGGVETKTPVDCGCPIEGRWPLARRGAATDGCLDGVGSDRDGAQPSREM